MEVLVSLLVFGGPEKAEVFDARVSRRRVRLVVMPPIASVCWNRDPPPYQQWPPPKSDGLQPTSIEILVFEHSDYKGS